MKSLLLFLTAMSADLLVHGADSLPRLDKAPQTVKELWAGYNPRSEPLEVRVVREWKEGNLTLRYVLYFIGTFKEETATMAAFYGFPADGKELPAIMHMHGGGQRASLAVAKRFAKRPTERGINESDLCQRSTWSDF